MSRLFIRTLHCATTTLLVLALSACLACSPPESVDSVRALHDEGRYAASLELLRALLEAEPENPELHFLYGVALQRTGEPGLAIWSLQRASQDPEWELAANLELASAALASRSFPTAVRAATRVLDLEPEHVSALAMRGTAYLGDRSRSEAALADFERILELDPENRTARVQRASALLLLARIEDAQAAIDELETNDEDDAPRPDASAHFCVARATFALEQGALEEAETAFERCLALFPTDWVVINEVVPFFDARGRPKRSEAILRAALEAEPTAAVYRSILAERMHASDRTSEAESLLLEGTLLENASSSAHAWSSLATLHLAQSNYLEAANAYEKALEFDAAPSQQRLLDLADLHALAGQHDRALEIAETFEQSLFQDLIHARVLLERDQPREALARLDSALLLWPNNASARYYAARACERIGDFDRAIEEYRQAIRANAEQTDAPIRLGRLLAASGAGRAALVAVGHRLRSRPNDPEALLIGLRVTEQLGDRAQADAYMARAQQLPGTRAQAFVISGEALVARRGADSAVSAMLANQRFDLTNPGQAPVLRFLLEQMNELGRTEEAAALVATALEKHPESGEFRAIRGLLLEQQGAPPGEVRAAYQSALEMDPDETTALMGMARLESGDVDAAIALYDRAIDADPKELAASREAALLLAGAGRAGAARERLEAVLRDRPFDAATALSLARLRISEGADREETLGLARRAVRFGAVDEGQELISRIESSRSQTAPPSL